MKKWQFWLGVGISAFFLWLALNGLKLGDFWEEISKANYWWLVPGVAVYFVAVWGRAWRWHYLLLPLKPIKTSVMFPITTIGYMGNNIYPARAGEVLRAVILKRKEGVAFSASFATIIVERIFDGVVMLGFVFLNLGELSKLQSSSGFIGNIQQVALIGSVIFILALVIFLVAAMFPKNSQKWIEWIVKLLIPSRFRDRILGIADRFLEGLSSLRSPFSAVMVLATTILIWLLETLKYWFVMHAFDFSVSFFALMLMNGIVNLATTIPSAPGYIGTFDAPGIAVLTAYGVDQAMAAGYTLTLHAALWIPITLVGLYYFSLEGLKWNESLRAESKQKDGSS